TVLDGDVSVEGADAVAIDSGTLVAAALSTPDTRGALVAVEGQSPPRTLVDTGQALRDAGLAVPRELEIEGRGGYPVHGWLAAPDGEGPFPTILMIHGGPYAAYGSSGSSGRGRRGS